MHGTAAAAFRNKTVQTEQRRPNVGSLHHQAAVNAAATAPRARPSGERCCPRRGGGARVLIAVEVRRCGADRAGAPPSVEDFVRC